MGRQYSFVRFVWAKGVRWGDFCVLTAAIRKVSPVEPSAQAEETARNIMKSSALINGFWLSSKFSATGSETQVLHKAAALDSISKDSVHLGAYSGTH